MQYDENAEKYGYEGEMTPIECDELQSYKGDVTIPVYGTIADAEVYLKSEADKVIAELKDDVTYWKKVAKKNMDDNVAMAKERAKAFESEHRRKHKQCVAMAGRCRLRGRLFGACGLYEKELWALKWHKRWLELAEKFKEAK